MEKEGHPYLPLKSLEEAKAVPDGVIIMQGDYGGQIFLTANVKFIHCDERALNQLLKDIDEVEWDDPDGCEIFYERLAPGSGVGGGMGGGRVEEEPWIHANLVAGQLDGRILDVLSASRPALFSSGSRESEIAKAKAEEGLIERKISDALRISLDTYITSSEVRNHVQDGAMPREAGNDLFLRVLEYGFRSVLTIPGDVVQGMFRPWPAKSEIEAIAMLRQKDPESNFQLVRTSRGWIRVYFSHLVRDSKIDAIIGDMDHVLELGLKGTVSGDKVVSNSKREVWDAVLAGLRLDFLEIGRTSNGKSFEALTHNEAFGKDTPALLSGGKLALRNTREGDMRARRVVERREGTGASQA